MHQKFKRLSVTIIALALILLPTVASAADSSCTQRDYASLFAQGMSPCNLSTLFDTYVSISYDCDACDSNCGSSCDLTSGNDYGSNSGTRLYSLFTSLRHNCGTAAKNTTGTPTATVSSPVVAEPVSSLSAYAAEVIRLCNVERAKENLAPLSEDTALSKAAAIRASEINSVFSHTRPNGTSCFTALDEAKASYSMAGENIALGQQTPAEVVAAWMNSPGHRANIMDSDYSRIGVAVLAGNGAYRSGYAWSQFFAN